MMTENTNTAEHTAPLDQVAKEMQGFPFSQRGQLEQIATKLRFLSIVAPTEALCDEAQGGLGYILEDIAAEVTDLLEDMKEECASRMAKLAGKPEVQQ